MTYFRYKLKPLKVGYYFDHLEDVKLNKMLMGRQESLFCIPRVHEQMNIKGDFILWGFLTKKPP